MMPQTTMFCGREVPVIPLIPDDDDDWCCDFCNGEIQVWRTAVIGEVVTTVPAMVPMLRTNALCLECAQRHGFPERWEQLPITFCACEGCAAQLERTEGGQAR